MDGSCSEHVLEVLRFTSCWVRVLGIGGGLLLLLLLLHLLLVLVLLRREDDEQLLQHRGHAL